MLTKCPECANDVSSAATACPKCGHPLVLKSAETPEQKVSHSAGWISLAAIILGSFTPAILAPIFVLVSLIFAGKELSNGGRTFGSIVLCLALLQGWFVLDHFGHISGTLGITTEKDVNAKAESKYANVSTDVPSEWREIAATKCNEEWPADYSMQQHCVEQQTKGVQTLDLGAPSDIEANVFRVIRGKCAEEWPRDFQMRAHCESKQFDGYRSLNASTVGDSTRNACAQQWPDDYQMRQYCQTKER